MIAARARHDRITTSQAVLPDEMRCDVRIARLGEVAVRGSSDEATVARRVEPTLCLAVGDDRRRRLLRLVIPLAAAAPVTPAASAIAVELLVVLSVSGAVLVSVATALFAVMVAMVTVLAGRAVVGTSILTRSTLLLLSHLARRFR
jgi:hypothetical protein